MLPHYVQIHHVDLENTIPNSSDFLDSINADIAAVLQVPRVAAGQERGSTFAATFNANLWAVQAISRMHKVLQQAVRDLFSAHLTLLNIPHKKGDLPEIFFDAMDSETPLNVMQRASMGSLLFEPDSKDSSQPTSPRLAGLARTALGEPSGESPEKRNVEDFQKTSDFHCNLHCVMISNCLKARELKVFQHLHFLQPQNPYKTTIN